MGLAKKNIRDMNGVAAAVKQYYLEKGREIDQQKKAKKK